MLNVHGSPGREIEYSKERGYNVTMNWLRTKVSFEVLKSALLSVRVSRTPWYRKGQFNIFEDFLLVGTGLEM